MADIDNYLRVVVTYTDRRGADKTAEGVTDEMVEARTVSNAAPKFGDIDPIKVDENATGSIGDPIVATDSDNDLLQYFKDDDGADKADNARFKMSTSGQLSLAKALNYELTDDGERDDAAAEYGRYSRRRGRPVLRYTPSRSRRRTRRVRLAGQR